MANIYTKRAVSDYANAVETDKTGVKILQNQASDWEKQSEGTEQKAKKQYSQAVQIDWQNSMNEIANNPKFSANPTAMQAEMKKLNDKMAAEIVDDDVKYDFYVNAELKGQSLLNSARAKFNKIQDDNTRSLFSDSIYSGIDTEATVLANGMTGVGDASDLANAVYSNDTITAAIERKNPDGSYMFNDAQRKQFVKDRETAAFNSFKLSFNELPEYKRKEIYTKIKEDRMSFGILKDKDGNEKELYLQDVVSGDTYRKYKEFAQQKENNEFELEKRKIAMREFEEKQKTYDTEIQLSEQLDDLEPSQALQVLEQNQGIVSDKYYKAKTKALLSASGITADTRAQEASDILLGISSLESIEDNEEYIKEADNILTKIENTYAEGNLLLSDKKTLTSLVKKKIGSALPTFIDEESHWWNKYSWSDAHKDIKKSLNDDATTNSVFLDYFRTLSKSEKEYTEPQKRDLVKTLVNQYVMKELNSPSFKNVEEMRAALNSGKIKEGETIYVGGKRGKAKLQ